MSIVTIVNERTDEEETLAKGTVKAVYFNEIKADQRKDYGKDGKSWIPTHRVTIVIDDDKISAGMYVQEEGKDLVLRAKDKEGNYQNVTKGAVVTVEVQKGKPYKGVDQYSCFPNKILVREVSKEVPTQAGSQAPARKSDPTELIAGNARNTAAILVRRFGVDFNEAITYASQVSHNAKIEYAATDSKMTEYQVGVSVGEAVKIAAELATDMSSIPDYITAYLSDQVPHSLEVVKSMKGSQEFVTPELPSEAGKAKPVKTKVAPKPKKEEPSLADLDDDSIPF